MTTRARSFGYLNSQPNLVITPKMRATTYKLNISETRIFEMLRLYCDTRFAYNMFSGLFVFKVATFKC